MSNDIPQKLRSVGHYIKIANEYRTRDPVVYYWSLFYAVQTGMKIDRSPECQKYLVRLLETLEQVKKQMVGNEAITNDMIAQAHIEQVALQLFAYADNLDRQANYTKNIVKSFYTAGHLFDVLTTFGELDEQLVANRKYAKWKATYIHNCLKQGEMPVPGPPGGFENEAAGGDGGAHEDEFGFKDEADIDVPMTKFVQQPPQPPPFIAKAASAPNAANMATGFREPSTAGAGYSSTTKPTTITTANNQQLSAAALVQGQKFAKYAVSALTYEDVPTAVDNLEKALRVLTTGQCMTE